MKGVVVVIGLVVLGVVVVKMGGSCENGCCCSVSMLGGCSWSGYVRGGSCENGCCESG